MKEKRQLEIFAGNSPSGVSDFTISELRDSFCCSQDDFEVEWPNETSKKYRLTIIVEEID